MADRVKIAKRIARRYKYRLDKQARRNSSSRRQKTAGEVRFVRDQGDKERDIPDDFNFKKSELKTLSRVLWGLSCSLGHLISAHTKFTKLKAVNISPDGLFGGKGYIQNIKNMRQSLSECVETISESVDTIHDEIEAPHWSDSWSEMSYQEKEETEEMIDDSEEIVGDPEEFAEEEYEEEIEDDVAKQLEEIEDGIDED